MKRRREKKTSLIVAIVPNIFYLSISLSSILFYVVVFYSKSTSLKALAVAIEEDITRIFFRSFLLFDLGRFSVFLHTHTHTHTRTGSLEEENIFFSLCSVLFYADGCYYRSTSSSNSIAFSFFFFFPSTIDRS